MMDDRYALADTRAHQARSRLGAALAELERRRRRLLDLRGMLARHPAWVLLGVGSALVGTGAGIGAWVVWRKQAPRRRRRALRQAWTRAWAHPERVARYAERTLPQALLHKGLWAFLAAAVGRWAKGAGEELGTASVARRKRTGLAG